MSESRFDRTADRYVVAAQKKDWTAFIELCRPQPDDRALDVAAGPALLSAQLVPLVARAVALEPSRPLLEHAPEGVEPVLGEAEQMPFQDSSFELVTIVNSLHHVADMRAALAEMVRVVTQGGRIVVQDYLADEDPERAEVWERVERLRDPDHRRLPRPGEVHELLAEHGFGEDEAQTWTASWSLDDWLEIAEPPYAAETEIRRLVASDRFELTAWRARFTAR
jgi:SAM-dependent methyltransferase